MILNNFDVGVAKWSNAQDLRVKRTYGSLYELSL